MLHKRHPLRSVLILDTPSVGHGSGRGTHEVREEQFVSSCINFTRLFFNFARIKGNVDWAFFAVGCRYGSSEDNFCRMTS